MLTDHSRRHHSQEEEKCTIGKFDGGRS